MLNKKIVNILTVLVLGSTSVILCSCEKDNSNKTKDIIAQTMITQVTTTETTYTETNIIITDNEVIIGDSGVAWVTNKDSLDSLQVNEEAAAKNIYDIIKKQDEKDNDIKLLYDGLCQIQKKYYHSFTQYTDSANSDGVITRNDSYYVNVKNGDVYLFVGGFGYPNGEGYDKIVLIT